MTPAVTPVNRSESVLRVPAVSGTGCLWVILSAKSRRAIGMSSSQQAHNGSQVPPKRVIQQSLKARAIIRGS